MPTSWKTRLLMGALPVAALLAACGSDRRSGFDDAPAAARGASSGNNGTAQFGTEPAEDGGAASSSIAGCAASSADMAGCACDPGTTRSCYTGPPSTRGIGVCADGVQQCEKGSELGGVWGPCTGAKMPAAESCKGSVDSNCNGKIGCDDPTCANDASCKSDCTDGDTKPCYTGPFGTVNVGVCKAGTQTCVGGKWSTTCAGQVLPGAEVCTDSLDNDCNGLVDCADPVCALAANCCTPQTGNVDGTIWANSSTQLYRVDPTTFAVTTIGSFDTGEEMTDVAVTPNGVLYGISFTTLYTINTTTAKGTALVSVGGSGNNSLSFLPNGTLLAADSDGDAKVINPVSGTVTTIGNYGNGLSSSGDLVSVQNGTMYGISSTKAGGGDASNDNVLIRVNTSSGAGTVVGPTGKSEVWGLAFAGSKVIGFTTGGQILQIDPITGSSSVIANKGIAFWGAGQSPLVPLNGCK